jgi:hypothetical protein
MGNPRIDLFDLCKVVDATFWPLNRQELSRSAGGRTQAKDFGTPLWRASFTTAPALRYDAADIEAALISLNGSVGSFLAYDVRRPYPRAHRAGDFTDAAEIGYLSPVDGFILGLSGMPQGFTLSPGDYIGFEYGGAPSRSLHMVTEGSVFDGSGAAVVRVFPAIPPGAALSAPVTFKRAPCEMILEPGGSPPSLRDMVASSVTFTAIQII